MRTGTRSRVVLVNCGSMPEARRIAQAVVGKRLAACVNILPAIQSVYRWKGKIETAREFPVVIKTTAARLAELEQEVKRLHRYDVPEFLAVAIASGSQDYLDWLARSVKK